MKRLLTLFLTLLTASILGGCATGARDPGWITLIDGEKGLENWHRLDDANWRAEGGAIVADRGKGGFLVSKNSYRDFQILAEFWADSDTNSGIFIRLSDPAKVRGDNSYEVNIWDIRPDPKYGTGGIVGFATVPVPPIHKAGGRWNTMEIDARGADVTVTLNGVITTRMQNGKFPDGPVALQFGAGVDGAIGGPIRWRRVQIKPL